MNSNPSKDDDHSMFMNKTPHFFKVILMEAIRDGKLGIPRNFVRRHGKLLSSPIKLEVPSGAIWQVELTKCDDRVWLQKGWKEFSEYYSIELGHFVVFRYEGNAHFHVLIFDKSASEIVYPCTITEDPEDDDISASRKSKEKSHLPCPRPHKKLSTNLLHQLESNSKFEILSPCNSLDDSASSRIHLGNLNEVEELQLYARQMDATKEVGGLAAQRIAQSEVFSFMNRMTAIEKAQALQRVSSFKSTKHPAFMVLMRENFVHYYKMPIPSNFARKFLPMQKGSLILCNSTGKTWPVKYYVHAGKKNPSAQLNRSGWRVFAEDNNLDVGDICVFELIKHPDIVLKVVIYPVVENANKACRPLSNGSIGGRVKIRNLVNETKPKRRQSGCPSNSIELKTPKIKENENTHPCIEILDDFPLNQKTRRKSPSPCFQPSKMMRINESGSIQATKGVEDIMAPRSLQRLTAAEKVHAMQKASTLESTKNPVFMVVMQPSFVSNSYRMGVPSNITRKFFKMEKGDLTLCNSTGKTWSVKCSNNGKCKGLTRVQLRHGWRAFAQDNNLDVGDVCVFEVIKRHEMLLKVVNYHWVVEKASKICNPQANGRVTSGVKIRSLVGDIEPTQSQCPSSSQEFKDPKIEENENVHSSIEISDDVVLNQKTKKKSKSTCFQHCNTMISNPGGSIQAKGTKLMEQNRILTGDSQYPAKDDNRRDSGAWRCLKPDLMSRLQPLTRIDKERALVRSSALKSTTPFFIVKMQPSYVVSGGSLCIPYRFAKRYLKKKGEVILRVSDGRTWNVGYKRKISSLSRKAKFLSKSWREFVLDNNVKVGDICYFILIGENGNLLEVVITSAADVSSHSSSKHGYNTMALD